MGRGSEQIGRILNHKFFGKKKRDGRLAGNYKAGANQIPSRQIRRQIEHSNTWPAARNPPTASLICNGGQTKTDHMKLTIRWNRFTSCTLFLSLTGMLCLWSIDSGRAQDKTGGAVGAKAQAEDLLDLRGDVPESPANRRARVAQIAPGGDAHDRSA